jgi:FMN phosphatase YigB (HAD superfamily)
VVPFDLRGRFVFGKQFAKTYEMKQVDLAIFDLDNTLYDWYSAFLPAFYAMVDRATELLNCDRETLLDELRAVHVRHHDVEHPFSLFETPTARALVDRIGSEEAWKFLDPAFHAYNSLRKSKLSLFPNTIETLHSLRAQKIKLVAFTDSNYFAALGRIDRLGLSELFSRIYCRKRSSSELPNSRPDVLAKFAEKVTELPAHESKPNPDVLADIAKCESIEISPAAYIGDSIAKDVLMAKRAGCFSVWAKYGAHTNEQMYARLIRISHWTTEDIEREKSHARDALSVRPDFVCEHSIAEILSAIVGPSKTKARVSA